MSRTMRTVYAYLAVLSLVAAALNLLRLAEGTTDLPLLNVLCVVYMFAQAYMLDQARRRK